MKITMYELLGLVKDGKAPKTIIYRDKIRKINQKSWRKKHPKPYKGKNVLVYDKNNNFICEFNSIKETAKELNYSVSSVSCFLRNKRDCIKYNFKYKENKNE